MTLTEDLLIPDELLAEATPSELAAYRARLEAELLEDAALDLAELEADWQRWLQRLFPGHVDAGFAAHHEWFWTWLWAVEAEAGADPFVGVWARGGAKSTSAELGCVALGARRRRRYGLYVCETQDQADDHVRNVAELLESPGVERLYPELAKRAAGKYGNWKGWRRNRLWTQSGFVLDAMGLDTASRGVKLDDQRPDLIVLDDLDAEHDSAAVVERKISTLTRKLLPAGAAGLVVLAIQNLVHPDSIFARLSDSRAEFLARRVVSGPVPAVTDMAVEEQDGRSVIVAGEATWAGMDLEACQAKVDELGITAFRAECQHEVDAPPGGMFDHLTFRHCTPEAVPDLVRCVVWVDPAVTATDQSDSMGIQADGIAVDGTIYRLWSWEQRATPLAALKRAIRIAQDFGADHVGVETDQGGDTWESVYREAAAAVEAEDREVWEADGNDPAEFEPEPVPPFTSAKAGAGHGPKTHRASQMLADYEGNGRIVHVLGTHELLERALRRFPLTKPLDLVDAGFWSWRDLRPDGARRRGGLRFRTEAAA